MQVGDLFIHKRHRGIQKVVALTQDSIGFQRADSDDRKDEWWCALSVFQEAVASGLIKFEPKWQSIVSDLIESHLPLDFILLAIDKIKRGEVYQTDCPHSLSFKRVVS